MKKEVCESRMSALFPFASLKSQFLYPGVSSLFPGVAFAIYEHIPVVVSDGALGRKMFNGRMKCCTG